VITSGTVSAAGAEFGIEAVQRATTAPGTYTGTLHLQVQLPFSRLNRDIPITTTWSRTGCSWSPPA
jgi:hypothetical protein